MDIKKIFVFLPDGVGLRNFAYSGFAEKCALKGYDVVYWNNTPFPLDTLGFSEIRMRDVKMHPMTYMYKAARKEIELTLNKRKTGDKVYDTYRFAMRYNGLKQSIKNIGIQILIATHSSEKGLKRIKNKIDRVERQTDTYRRSYDTLQKEKPDLLFLTNQRQSVAISTVLAAKDLAIPTATFIFSWDNLPKATMVVETDYYIVWSDLMKEQLLFYYSEIKPEQVFITGTPQFEPHFNPEIIIPRETFFARHGMDIDKKYICFSGDDFTSSPDDPAYLEDTARAIRSLNEKGHNLGIAFRRCPPDVSGRYKDVVAKYDDVITELEPQWKTMGETWAGILPMPEDLSMLANTIAHTELVVNLGSSMVFDYVSFGKPCAYFNYNQPERIDPNWDLHTCYKYVHFRSMPSKDAVVWLNDKSSLASNIESMLSANEETVTAAQQWFEIVNQPPATKASDRILEAFEKIITPQI